MMGNPRTFTRNFIARNRELEAALKGAGVRSEKRRRELMSRAASGRPSDIAVKARNAIDVRRRASKAGVSPEIQRALDEIEGRGN